MSVYTWYMSGIYSRKRHTLHALAHTHTDKDILCKNNVRILAPQKYTRLSSAARVRRQKK